jgi:cytochrome P450
MPKAINGAILHAALNDEFNGYHITAGSGIVLSVWSANNDPSRFPQPRIFDPRN